MVKCHAAIFWLDAIFSDLKMEAACSSETSIPKYEAIRLHILELAHYFYIN